MKTELETLEQLRNVQAVKEMMKVDAENHKEDIKTMDNFACALAWTLGYRNPKDKE